MSHVVLPSVSWKECIYSDFRTIAKHQRAFPRNSVLTLVGTAILIGLLYSPPTLHWFAYQQFPTGISRKVMIALYLCSGVSSCYDRMSTLCMCDYKCTFCTEEAGRGCN